VPQQLALSKIKSQKKRTGPISSNHSSCNTAVQMNEEAGINALQRRFTQFHAINYAFHRITIDQ